MNKELLSNLCLSISTEFGFQSSKYASETSPEFLNFKVMTVGTEILEKELKSLAVTKKILKAKKTDSITLGQLSKEVTTVLMKELKESLTA